jgi:poly-D-alanine transfer protein DltD
LARFLLKQLLAALTALALLVALDRAVVAVWPDHNGRISVDVSFYMPNWVSDESAPLVQHVLNEPHDILLFGSSELSSVYGVEPFELFPKKRGVPLLAVGAGGAQSLTILTVLLEHEKQLGPWSRIVVMLSPWWFLNPGTDAHAIRQYTSTTALLNIAANKNLPEKFKAPIETFLREKMQNINPPTAEMMLLRYPSLQTPVVEKLVHEMRVSLPDFVREHSRIYQAYFKRDFNFNDRASKDPSFNWEQALAEAKTFYTEHSKSNEYGFIDTSWPSYKGTVPRDLQAPRPEMTELHDLQTLVEFLKYKNVPVLFVMQPLNHLAYRKLERFDALKGEIAKVMQDTGTHYVDYLSAPPETEMLIDLAHLSSYGWLKVDREIENWLESLK